MTLGVYAVDWLKDTSLTVKPSTAQFYKAALTHLEPLHDVPVVALTPAHVRSLITTATEQGLASRTVRGIVQTLNLVLRRAEMDGIVTRNVAGLVRLPKLTTKEPQHFTAEQARRFLEVAKDDGLGSIYAVALGTGLRRGELLGLNWSDVSPRLEYLSVRDGKTAAASRVVPIAGFARDALVHHRDDQRRAMASGSPLRRDRIWADRPEFVSDHFKELCRQAGVPVLTFHSLRHSAASLMLDAGVDPLVIQQIMGHTTVSMTGHYARSGDALRRAAVDALSGTIVGHKAVANGH